MNIRRAHEKDIPRLIELLEQVLQIHADIRPDIFIPGTTKYTNEAVSYTHLDVYKRQGYMSEINADDKYN